MVQNSTYKMKHTTHYVCCLQDLAYFRLLTGT